MDALLEDALAVVRDETHAIDRTSLSLRSVANRAWDDVDTRDATLTIEGDREIAADPVLVVNVFENLFRNAVEHAGPDVTVFAGPLDDGFYVEDDGPGVPEADRDDLFEIGFTTKPEGTGFGLGIVRRIVEKHGWEIDVGTGRTGGARFEVHTQPVFPDRDRSLPLGVDE